MKTAGRAVTTLFTAASPVFAGPEPAFIPLGDLEGGMFLSVAYGVSGDGSVVVGQGRSGSGTEAFRWTRETGMEGLGDLEGGGFESTGRAVSIDGSTIVGDSLSGSGLEAFRWRAEGGIVGIGDLPGGDFFSIASAVSADGSVIVGHSGSGGSGSLGAEAFRWTDPAGGGNGMVGLGDLAGGAFFSVGTGVSGDGTRVAGYSSSSRSGAAGSESFLWTVGGGLTAIGDIPGGAFGSNAFGMSEDGVTIVGIGVSSAGVEAFRWTAAGFIGLGDLPGGGYQSRANGVSGDGSVVVGQSITERGFEAFVWTEEDGIRNVRVVLETEFGEDLTGWTLEVAQAVSADGSTVVGYGRNPDGLFEAWAAVIGGGSECAPDWNGDGVVTSDDFFAFLTDFFAGNGDFNGSGATDSDDFFAFLTAFFEGCV